MSTLASKAQALERHRRAVAREIMLGLPWAPTGDGHSVRPPYLWSTGRAAALAGPDDLLGGDVTFDVHAAREHALHLVDPLLGPLADLDVFTEWTRAKGLGPENREPGAFGRVGDGFIMRVVTTAQGPHQWSVAGVTVCVNVEPGRPVDEQLAEAVSEQVDGYQAKASGGRVHVRRHAPGGWPGKLAREWPGDPRAPMGRSLARLGQRILAMLEGQASECQSGACLVFLACDGKPRPDCPDCHGTGHNIRGKLPGVEWSPAVRRKARETANCFAAAGPRPPGMLPFYGHAMSWLDGAYEAGRDSGWMLAHSPPGHEEFGYRYTVATRVWPRGEHRHTGTRDPEHDLDRRISERGWDTWGDEHKTKALGAGVQGPRELAADFDPRPKWCTGEAEHARQRRERAARRRFTMMEAPSTETTSGSDRLASVHRACFRVLGVAAFEYFRGCMDDRSPVDLTRISSGLPDGEWVVDGLSTEADTADGLTWTEVSITRLIRVELPGRIESVRVEETFTV